MSQSQAQQMAQLRAMDPPYPPRTAAVGGTPTVPVDVPALSIFVALYLTSAISNIFIFQTNRKKGHKFIPSVLLVGFSMARVMTCVLRIAWAANQHNVSLAIAASIFVNAGILIIYILNILFSQRILRALHPHIGWRKELKMFFVALYCLIGVALVLVIVLSVMSFFTLDMAILNDAKWIQRGAITFLFIVAAMPLFVLAFAYSMPRTGEIDGFGKGGLTSKTIILLIGSCICTTIAGFKVGTTWEAPRPIDDPAWYQSKAAFYIFNFSLEIVILVLYTSSRIDRRFHVPNGSSKRKTHAVADRTGSESSAYNSGDLDPEKKRDSGLGDA